MIKVFQYRQKSQKNKKNMIKSQKTEKIWRHNTSSTILLCDHI